MNDVQRRAWDAHADRWLVERPQVDGGIDRAALFGRAAPLVLEIGSGMGDATAAMAAARPEIDVLAVEVYKPGIAQTFNHLARAGVDNVRVLRADAVEALRTVVAPGSLAEVWLFFPDPWPKNRHVKRRLVTPEFAALVASRLVPGGSWWMATDWAPYAQQMLRAVRVCPDLVNPHEGAGEWAPRPDFRPPTRFERRGLAESRAIFDLHAVRRAVPPSPRGSTSAGEDQLHGLPPDTPDSA
jgi:tRNA (guanine-N7-)-methyltransferase